MEFEFDSHKSASNLDKHGIAFEEAKALWNDPNYLEITIKTSDEPRLIIIGMIKNKHWTAIVTLRNNGIRIISVRRSHENEVRIYEG